MSEFQLSLLAAGGVTIAAVWAYNRWQERKHRQAAEKLISGQRGDILGADLKDADPAPVAAAPVRAADPDMDAGRDDTVAHERREPTLGLPQEPVLRQEPPMADIPVAGDTSPPVPAGSQDAGAAATIPVAQAGAVVVAPAPAVASVAAEEAARPTAEEDVSPADTMADCILRFALPAPVPAASVWAAQSTWSPLLGKTPIWLGRNTGDMAWRFVTADAVGRYAEWIAALPLADRRGAVSDADIGQFFDGVEQVAGQLGTQLSLPGRAETLARAHQLDAFCAEVDIQFSIHVVEASGGSFAGTKLRGVCEAAGLLLDADGVFRARDDGGAELFAIANMGSERFSPEAMRTLATHGITLTLDVPRVADGTLAFARMITTAQQLARGLGGILVDAQRAPLADAMTGLIRGKIAELQQRMKAAQILPGSARARRLFS